MAWAAHRLMWSATQLRAQAAGRRAGRPSSRQAKQPSSRQAGRQALAAVTARSTLCSCPAAPSLSKPAECRALTHQLAWYHCTTNMFQPKTKILRRGRMPRSAASRQDADRATKSPAASGRRQLLARRHASEGRQLVSLLRQPGVKK